MLTSRRFSTVANFVTDYFLLQKTLMRNVSSIKPQNSQLRETAVSG